MYLFKNKYEVKYEARLLGIIYVVIYGTKSNY